jgi:hypothetical protein
VNFWVRELLRLFTTVYTLPLSPAELVENEHGVGCVIATPKWKSKHSLNTVAEGAAAESKIGCKRLL